MGNWRRVHILGTCDSTEVGALRRALTLKPDYSNFHCLIDTGGLAGTGNWANRTISAVGNLAERDYDVEDVQATLEQLAAAAPSLNVIVHCGADRESATCIASVVLLHGKATIEPARVETLPEIDLSEGVIMARIQEQIARQRTY